MNCPYVLIEKDCEKFWAMIIEKVDEGLIDSAMERWQESLINQLLDGRRGLTIDLINKFVAENTIKFKNFLKEGHIILINEMGGYQFLEDNMTILKRGEFNYFPKINEHYINGILTQDGKLIRCNYGHHYEITQDIKDDNNSYISISTDTNGDNSAIFIGDTVTENQINFIIDNLEGFNKNQLKILKQKKII